MPSWYLSDNTMTKNEKTINYSIVTDILNIFLASSSDDEQNTENKIKVNKIADLYWI